MDPIGEPPDVTPVAPPPVVTASLASPEPAASPRPPPAPRLGGCWGGGVVSLLIVALLGLMVLTAAGRVLRTPGAPLVLVTTFLPYLYAALALVGFTTWCVVPDRRSLPVLLAAVFVTAGVLWGPAWPARPDVAEGDLVVMSWNVQRLWGGEEPDAAACVARVVQEQDPDVLTVLEVSKDRLDSLSATLGMACVYTDYYGTGAGDRGGLAVCTRADGWQVTGAAQRFFDADGWRYVLAEVTRPDGRVFNVFGVHLDPYWPLTGEVIGAGVRDLALGAPGPLLQASEEGVAVSRIQGARSAALLDRLGRLHDPTLVTGDFNSTRDSALHTALRETLVDTWERGGQGFGATVTALGWVPLRVDYVYATPDFAVADSAVLDTACSDHRPVLSRLSLR